MFVNQLRTLLLNQNGSQAAGPAYPGEEYVPPTFMARPLQASLQEVYALLFGLNPDRAMLNWRLRELMAILHTTELAEFVFDLDPRVTYWPPTNNTFFTQSSAQPTVTTIQGTDQLYPLTLVPVQGQEQLYYSYLVTVIDSTHVTVQNEVRGGLVTHTYSSSGGLSSAVPLDGSTVNVQFQSTNGDQWRVTFTATPGRDLASAIRDLQSGVTPTQLAALFGVTPVEPYLTFQNLWLEHPQLPYQIGGLTLGLGYQINALYQ